MVVIINGEIVADSDPRALARKAPLPSSASSTKGGPRVNTFNTIGQQQQQQQQQQQRRGSMPQQPSQQPGDEPDGLLTPLSQLIGVAGKRVSIPPVPQINFQGYSFPLIHLLVSAGSFLVFNNWRYALVCFVALAVLNPK